MDIKVGDVFKFKGTDEGVFSVDPVYIGTARLRVRQALEYSSYQFVLQHLCGRYVQYANTEEIMEVLEKVTE